MVYWPETGLTSGIAVSHYHFRRQVGSKSHHSNIKKGEVIMSVDFTRSSYVLVVSIKKSSNLNWISQECVQQMWLCVGVLMYNYAECERNIRVVILVTPPPPPTLRSCKAPSAFKDRRLKITIVIIIKIKGHSFDRERRLYPFFSPGRAYPAFTLFSQWSLTLLCITA